MRILFPKNLSFFVKSIIILSTMDTTAQTLFDGNIKASSDTELINSSSFEFLFTEHIDVGSIGIGMPNWLFAVLSPFSSVAAIPDDAVAIDDKPSALKAANIAFRTNVSCTSYCIKKTSQSIVTWINCGHNFVVYMIFC